jgi:hypothetical protein
MFWNPLLTSEVKVIVEVNLLVEQRVYAKGELLFIQLKEDDTGDPW